MPQIDTYTAQTRPVVPDQPFRFVATGENPAAGVEAAGVRFGTNLTAIAGNINEQASQLEWRTAQGARENKHDQTILDLQNDPEVIADPTQFVPRYRQIMQDFDAQQVSQFKHPEAAAHYQFYRETKGEADDIRVQAAGLKLQASKNHADYLLETARLSDQAASATTSREYNANVELHNNLLDESVKNRALTPQEAATEKIRFNQQTAEKNMFVVGSRNPSEMRMRLAMGDWPDSAVPADKKAKILWEINTHEHVENERKAAEFHQASQVAHMDYLVTSGHGDLPQWMIDDGKAGNNPFIKDPRVWEQLEKRNQEKPGITSNDLAGIRQVEMVRTIYGLNPHPTRESDEAALADFQDMILNGNLSDKALTHAREAVEHFGGEIRKRDTEVRQQAADVARDQAAARRQVVEGRQDITFGQHQLDRKKVDARRLLKNQLGELPPVAKDSFVGRMQVNHRNWLMNELDTLLDKNPAMKIEDAVSQIAPKNNQLNQGVRQNPASDLMRPR